MKETARTHTFENGLRLIQIPSPTNVAYCGISIDAGTRDEEVGEEGMAHFCEHMMFKGTEKRKAWHIINRMEAVGGDLNAYTNKEETVVYSAFMKEHFERAAELIFDIVFHSTYPQHEIDKECEVIVDEIESYNDTPSDLIFDRFEDLIYEGNSLGQVSDSRCAQVCETAVSTREDGILCVWRCGVREGKESGGEEKC